MGGQAGCQRADVTSSASARRTEPLGPTRRQRTFVPRASNGSHDTTTHIKLPRAVDERHTAARFSSRTEADLNIAGPPDPASEPGLERLTRQLDNSAVSSTLMSSGSWKDKITIPASDNSRISPWSTPASSNRAAEA